MIDAKSWTDSEVPLTKAEWHQIGTALLTSGVAALEESNLDIGALGEVSRHGKEIDLLEGVSRLFMLGTMCMHAQRENPGFVANADAERAHATLLRWIVDGCHGRGGLCWPSPDHGRSNAVLEAAALALCFLISWDTDWRGLSVTDRSAIVQWMLPATQVRTTPNNWILFPLVVEMFLVRAGCVGGATSDLLSKGLAAIDEWYVGGGWYSDGPGRTLDYYNSWSFHFYLPLLAFLFGDSSATQVLGSRCREFNDRYRAFFDSSGAHVYFGRSMTYRFAATASLSVQSLTCPSSADPENRQISDASLRYFLRNGAADGVPPLPRGWWGAQPEVAQSYSGPLASFWGAKAFVKLLIPSSSSYWRAVPDSRAESSLTVLDEPGLLARHMSGTGAILYNHGTFNAASITPHSPADDPQYSRIGYSSVTSPAWSARGTDMGFQLRAGLRVSARSRVHPRDYGPDWLSSESHYRLPNRFPIPGRVGWHLARILPTGPARELKRTSTVEATVAVGQWALHIVHVDGIRARLLPQFGGWAVSGRASAFIDKLDVGRAATMTSIHRSDLAVLTNHRQTSIETALVPGPFGESARFPLAALDVSGGGWAVVATRLISTEIKCLEDPPKLEYLWERGGVVVGICGQRISFAMPDGALHIESEEV